MAFIDPREGDDRDFPPVHIFEVPQLVSPGKVEPRRTLPSFLFLEEGQPIGLYAREQGALVPTKLVHSAKSWLSNPDVDRTAKILPWDSQETGRVLSPVEVSARFLTKFRESWEQAKGVAIAEQDVVLTVPASFDEEARELTVMAARDAGLEKLTLLEEPAAAFYSWIANNFERNRARMLFDGQVVLVCDVGGGHQRLQPDSGGARGRSASNFTRTAVGRALCCSEATISISRLAWLVEIQDREYPYPVRQRSGLRRGGARRPRNGSLSDPSLKSVEITVLGAGGSALIGRCAQDRNHCARRRWSWRLEGFLPLLARPARRRRRRNAASSGKPACPTSPILPSRGTWPHS